MALIGIESDCAAIEDVISGEARYPIAAMIYNKMVAASKKFASNGTLYVESEIIACIGRLQQEIDNAAKPENEGDPHTKLKPLKKCPNLYTLMRSVMVTSSNVTGTQGSAYAHSRLCKCVRSIKTIVDNSVMNFPPQGFPTNYKTAMRMMARG